VRGEPEKDESRKEKIDSSWEMRCVAWTFGKRLALRCFATLLCFLDLYSDAKKNKTKNSISKHE